MKYLSFLQFSLYVVVSFAFMQLASSFGVNNANTRSFRLSPMHALRRVAAGSEAPVTNPGVDIPKEIAQQNAIYDMILVERCSAPSKTAVGLFIPQVEGSDRKHVGLVLSIPADYGLESEQGRVQPIKASSI
jgi:hypothetical protein